MSIENPLEVYEDGRAYLAYLYEQEAIRLSPNPVRNIRTDSYEWALIRANIFKRDDYTCGYCHQRGGRLECDHIVPVSLGGSDEDANLTTSCFPCNRSKGAKLLAEWKR